MDADESTGETYGRSALVADVRYLAETLEASHPDPYDGHGGRVAFHRRVEEAVRAIPEAGESIAEFYPRVAEIAARVRDGHTDVSSPPPVGIRGQLPIRFRVVGDALYVDEVYDERHSDLLGGRLLAVNDVRTNVLRQQIAHRKGSDNRYQDGVALTFALRDVTPLRYLVGVPVREPTLEIEQMTGSTVTRTLDPRAFDDDASPVATLETSIPSPETSGEPAYTFLDDDRQTALLVLPDMFSYREAAEQLRGMGHEQAEELSRDIHERVVDGPVPSDLDDVIEALPSAVDVLTELVTEMAAADTERLLIDTTANTGGNSLLSNLLTYLLHGWDGMMTAGEDHVQVPKDSPLYRERIGEDGAVEETENPAGFDFGSYFDRDDRAARLDRLHGWLTKSETFAGEIADGEHEAYYRPSSIVVVTAAMTYSAGAEPAFTLSQLGATVVGVPPSQAPNVPRDALTDELPNTGLEYKTAYRYVESRPDVDGRVFRPDVELTPERFEAMGRPGDAGLRLALEGEHGRD